MNACNVRPATLEDEPIVLELTRLFFATSSFRQFRAATPAAELAAYSSVFRLSLEHGVCLLVEDTLQGNVDGFLAMALVPNLFSGELCAEEIGWFVHPDSRGGPAAGALWRAAEEWARQAGALTIKMVAPADEPAVGRLYRRRGYVAIEVAYHKRL